MKTRSIVAISAIVIAAGSLISAQGGTVRFVPPQPRMIRLLQPWVPEGQSGDTKIIGTVIDITQTPVANARVQLRDLNSGAVKQEAVAGSAGEYEFTVVEPGTYVVEMVITTGQVVGLSNAGSVGRYQTMNTVIILPGRWDASRSLMTMQQSMTSFFGMSSQKTMTAATLQAATDANVTPADPGEPVSP